jgi:hypothetical protein
MPCTTAIGEEITRSLVFDFCLLIHVREDFERWQLRFAATEAERAHKDRADKKVAEEEVLHGVRGAA